MSLDLLLDLLTMDMDLDESLVSSFHEVSKIWPFCVTMRDHRDRNTSKDIRAILAEEAPGILLDPLLKKNNSAPRTWSNVKKPMGFTNKCISLSSVASILQHALDTYLSANYDTVILNHSELMTYLLCWKVNELEPGSYQYLRSNNHKLIPIRSISTCFDKTSLVLNQESAHNAAMFIVLCAKTRSDLPYGISERHYRELLLHVGCLGTRLIDAAAAENLSAYLISDFVDDEVSLALGIDPLFENPLNVIALGKNLKKR